MAKRYKKVNRSLGGDIATVLFLILVGAFMVLPMLFAIGSSFKPNDELFRFPPTIFPQNWVTTNYTDLFVLMNTSWVPFTRYFFNTLFITAAGTIGQIICCSLCAFALSLHRFPGNKLTNHSCGIIINAVFMKGARSMKYSVIIRIDMVRLAPYALTR